MSTEHYLYFYFTFFLSKVKVKNMFGSHCEVENVGLEYEYRTYRCSIIMETRDA